MKRILRPGLVLIQYLGTIEILFRVKVEERRHITIKPLDHVLVDAVTAVYLTRGTQYKKVKTEVDLVPSVLTSDPLEFVDDKLIMEEMVVRGLLDHAPDIRNFTNEEQSNPLNKKFQAHKFKIVSKFNLFELGIFISFTIYFIYLHLK